MPGGNPPPRPPPSDHRKPRWPNSNSPAAQKPKPEHPSPRPNSNSNKGPITKPTKPENPSPRPDNPNPLPGPRPNFPDPPPPPSYGFHLLDRRSVVLADGSVRSYFALPPDYEHFAPRPELRGFAMHGPPFGMAMSPEFNVPDGRGPNRNLGPENSLLKRKIGEDDGFERQRQQLLQYGNANGPGPSGGFGNGPGPSGGFGNGPGPSGYGGFERGEEMRASKSMRLSEGSNASTLVKHSGIDQNALKKAFLHFVKLVFETPVQRKSYLADGKQGSLPCLVCGRSSKDYPDTHSLIMHAYNSDGADTMVDHLAFHKALCILMGWNYAMPPDNSKAYQKLSASVAEATMDDLIMWPPSVLIHNTITGKGRDGRMEGIGNRAMDSILRDLGFPSGKSMSLYSREGHLGIHTVKFSSDESGLKEALRLDAHFEREKHGRKDWARVQPETLGKDDENNPSLVKTNPRTGERKRVYYGHLATVADLDKVTFEIKKKVSIVSVRELKLSK